MCNLDLDIDKAYKFYREVILDYLEDRRGIFAEYNFPLQGSVPSRDWEAFAAILVKDKKKPGNGADLERHEVKSAVEGGSFEYQYHKHHGMEKLQEDREVNHIYISYSPDYLNVTVWLLEGAKLKAKFDTWEPNLVSNYGDDKQRQRFRKSVGSAFIRDCGSVRILEIRNGVISPTYAQKELWRYGP